MRNLSGTGRSTFLLVFVVAFAAGFGRAMARQGQPSAAPLRVDINSEGRADMRTVGWENWLPSEDDMRQSFGDITVTLRAGKGGSISLSGNKAILVHGVTVGAEGAIVTGGEPVMMEVLIEGLVPGPHTFVSYHHALKGAAGTYTVSISGSKVEGIQTSKAPRHNDEVGTSFIEFEAKVGQSVVIQIAATSGACVILNGFSLDVTDPHKKALKPMPVNYERHANGDNGKVALSWAPSSSAINHHVYMVSGHDAEAARRELATTTAKLTSVEGSSYSATIVPNNSLLHYAWRVDSVDAQGHITRGEVWQFRVRHLAFPTAEGYGRFAKGGRGGRVIHVTNLNDSGPGSLREAVEATGPRTVVFDVSGLISLESKLVFRKEHEFLTIAGQTAPGKGICIRNYTVGGLGGRDTIVRFVRLRLGSLTGKTMDGMGFASCDHCIIDHCSISWTIDEAFSSRGAKNITFQRNLISEALNIAGHSHYGSGSAHGFAGSIGGNVGSFHHSLLAHNSGRNWSLAGATDQANRHAGRLDIRNMVVYNWRHRTTDGGAKQVNFVNNYYKPGPASEVKTYLNPQFEHPAFGPQQYYVSGNIMEGIAGPEGPTGTFKGMKARGHQDAPVTVSHPFFEHHVKTHTAEDAYENVLADVGCNVPMLDDHDTRVIKETRTGTTTYKGSKSGWLGLPDSQEDVGGWEDYPEIHRPAGWDTDGDGMPNVWETQKALNPHDPVDGTADPDGDGYTYLEDYLNWLATGHTDGRTKGTIPTRTQVGAACLPDDIVPVQSPFPMPKFKKPQFPSLVVRITENGAKENVLATRAIQASIDAVSSKGGGKVIIPAGKWLTGRVSLKSHVNLHISEGAEVSFSGNVEDYRPAVFTRAAGIEAMSTGALIYANDQTNIAVTGKGTLIGPPFNCAVRNQSIGYGTVQNFLPASTPVSERVLEGHDGSPICLPMFISPINCKDVYIEGITLERTAFWNIVPIYCDGVIIRGVTVNSVGIPMGDGIDIESSRNVLIEYTTLNCGDDCFTMKAGRGADGMRVNKPTENIVIRYCLARKGHGGITLGSETAGVIRNLYLHDCVFDGTGVGIQFKTRRPRGGGGENVILERIRMDLSGTAIKADMLGSKTYVGELASRLPARPINKLTPRYGHVSVKDIIVETTGQFMKITGIPESPFSHFQLENADVKCNKLIRISDAKAFLFKNVSIQSADAVIDLLDVCDAIFDTVDFRVPGDEVITHLKGDATANIQFKNCTPEPQDGRSSEKTAS